MQSLLYNSVSFIDMLIKLFTSKNNYFNVTNNNINLYYIR